VSFLSKLWYIIILKEKKIISKKTRKRDRGGEGISSKIYIKKKMESAENINIASNLYNFNHKFDYPPVDVDVTLKLIGKGTNTRVFRCVRKT
jgi:hypothetical protein